MMVWGRKQLGETARDIADNLQLVENVKALQIGQKELASAIALVGERLQSIEADMKVMRAETKLEALRETQQIVNAVQGALNDKLTDLTTRVAFIERDGTNIQTPLIALPGSKRPSAPE